MKFNGGAAAPHPRRQRKSKLLGLVGDHWLLAAADAAAPPITVHNSDSMRASAILPRKQESWGCCSRAELAPLRSSMAESGQRP